MGSTFGWNFLLLRFECCWVIWIRRLLWFESYFLDWRWCLFRNCFLLIIRSKLTSLTFLGIKIFLFHQMVVQVDELLRCVWWCNFNHFEFSLVISWLLKIFIHIPFGSTQFLYIHHFDFALLLSRNLLLYFIILVDFLIHLFEVNLEGKWRQLHLVGLLII